MVKKEEVHIKVEGKRKESDKKKKANKWKYKGEKGKGNVGFVKKRGINEKGMQQFFQ